MAMINRSGKIRPARFRRYAALIIGAWLSSISLAVHADDVQDANRLFKQGQHSQALDKINGFLANHPKDAQARFLRGLIFTEQGETAEAIKVFSALTEDYPELPEPYNNLAVLYASKGQYDKARLALEMAIRTHPSYATAHENLGDIYAKMASQAYNRALQLDRSNTVTQTKLSMIQDLFVGGARSKSEAAPAAAQQVIEASNHPESAAAKPIVAATTLSAPAEKELELVPVKDNSSEVLATVKDWAAAWSAKNVDKYLSFYAGNFKTPHGESRSAWESARQERLDRPKFIKVSISNATVEFGDNNHATVKFYQSYQASHLKTSGNKILLMVKNGDKWLIQEERAK